MKSKTKWVSQGTLNGLGAVYPGGEITSAPYPGWSADEHCGRVARQHGFTLARSVLSNDLHENDFQRLKSIREALKTMDRGEYGECARCNEDISPKRLLAVPWARLCIRCQEETEKEHTLSRRVPAGPDQEETEL